MKNFNDFFQGEGFYNLMENYRNAKTNEEVIDAFFKLKEEIGNQVDAVVIVKNADTLKKNIIAADSLLTLFAFSPHIFLQPDLMEERKKECQKVGYALRNLRESIFSE